VVKKLKNQKENQKNIQPKNIRWPEWREYTQLLSCNKGVR